MNTGQKDADSLLKKILGKVMKIQVNNKAMDTIQKRPDLTSPYNVKV